MWKLFLVIFASILLILLIFYLIFHKQVSVFIVKVTGKKRIQRKLYKACKANDYLIINYIYLPVDNDKIRHVDTIIFANKYIYICSEISESGEVRISLEDNKWRVIYNNNLTLIDNPFIYNRKIIKRLVNVVDGLEFKDIKSLVILPKTCTFNQNVGTDNELIVKENEAIDLIIQIEKNSNEDIIDPYEAERYANAFYQYGLETEKLLKKSRR